MRSDSLHRSADRKCLSLSRVVLLELLDISPVSQLANLERLVLTGTSVSDIKPIATLQNLCALSIGGCVAIKSLEPLMKLDKLDDLCLEGTLVPDLEPIVKLQNLHILELERDASIDSLEPLAKLKGLQMLFLHKCYDLSPLAELKELRYLYLFYENTEETDLTPVAILPRLIDIDGVEAGKFKIAPELRCEPDRIASPAIRRLVVEPAKTQSE